MKTANYKPLLNLYRTKSIKDRINLVSEMVLRSCSNCRHMAPLSS
jgi:hypothetical protein